MRIITLACTTLVLCALVGSAQGPDKKEEEGFTRLFDGKTFAGWKTSDKTAKSWKIEEGMLRLTGGNNHLFTEKTYEDFIVRFEWRPAKKGYNSGFFIRGGNQIQMAQGDAGHLLSRGKDTKGVPTLHKAPGEWNEWEVTCIGGKCSLKVNGTLAWEIEDFKAKAGTLGIEAEGAAIDFRNLRIKEIKK